MSEKQVDPLALIERAEHEQRDWGDDDLAGEFSACQHAVAKLLEAARQVDALSIQSEAHKRLRLALRGIAANT